MATAPPTTVLPPRKKKKARKAKNSEEDEEEEGIVLKFRNYAPTDAPVPDESETPAPSAAKQAEEQIEKELQKSMVTSKDEAVSITAKSPDWDLKRDIADKMKKLNRQTLRAIRSLVAERIAADKKANGGSSSDSSSGSDSDDDSDSDGDSSDSDS